MSPNVGSAESISLVVESKGTMGPSIVIFKEVGVYLSRCACVGEGSPENSITYSNALEVLSKSDLRYILYHMKKH